MAAWGADYDGGGYDAAGDAGGGDFLRDLLRGGGLAAEVGANQGAAGGEMLLFRELPAAGGDAADEVAVMLLDAVLGPPTPEVEE